MNKVKQFLIDRGYYLIPKPVRHIALSAIMVFIFINFTSWPMAGLISWNIGFWKEVVENKGFNVEMGYDIVLNTLGVLFGILPFILEANF